MSKVKQLMVQIERDLDASTYHVGDWQKCLSEFRDLDRATRAILTEDLTRISNKLHRRNGFHEAPTWMGFVLEYLLLATSILMMTAESTLLRFISIILLVSCLQPLIKISMGTLLGVRYSYAYLWYVEPRFKMSFGTYQKLKKWQKVVLQLIGSIGTPLALFAGYYVLSDEPQLVMLFLAAALLAAIMQLSAFVASWLGVRKLGPFLLSNLTTPALLAKELKDRP